MTLTTSLRPAQCRTGFTLVELLVVIAIIGILVALTTVAVQKTVESQKTRTTKEQLYKLQQTLDSEYERVVQQCATDASRQQIPTQVMAYCDNEPNRAKSVWTAMQLRRQFPDSFQEAVTPFIGIPGYQLNPQVTFLGVAGVGSAAGAPDPNEGAALLYAIVASKSVAGGGAMAASGDDLGQQTTVTIGGKSFKAYVDAWGQPIQYCRWFGSGYRGHPLESDVQQMQYIGSVNQFAVSAGMPNSDPLDPRNLVLGWTTGGAPNAPKRAQMAAPSATGTGLCFNGKNRMATTYSSGKSLSDPTDDLMGYQLRRFGR